MTATANLLPPRTLLSLPLLLLPLAAGCALSDADAGAAAAGAIASAADSAPETSDAVQELGGAPPCAEVKANLANTCNVLACVNGVRQMTPAAAGTPCSTSAGSGVCDGGGPNGSAGSCIVTVTGKLFPRYLVLEVMYAPPGTDSSVTYAQGKTFGTTTSLTSSWTDTTSVTVSGGAHLDAVDADFELTTSLTLGASNQNTLDLKSTTTSSWQLTGFQDVVDHSLDEIWLWLNPEIDVSITGNSVTWNVVAIPGTTPTVVYMTPRWLTGQEAIPSGLLQELQAANIAPSDYPQILAVDPFASGATAIDPQRFVYLTTAPYEPPAVSGQHPAINTFSVDHETTQSSTLTGSVAYSVGYSVSAGSSFLGIFNSKIKIANELTVSHQTSYGSSTGASMLATASISQPAYGYAGPVQLRIYLDTLFNTFLFSLKN